MKVSLLLLAFVGLYGYCNGAEYYGELWGELVTNTHLVEGKVYVVDSHRLQLVDFTYDGLGPDAYFYVGLSGDTPREETGRKIPNEMGSEGRLGSYMNQNIVLNLPSNMPVTSLKWISVWCSEFSVDFGSLVAAPPSVIPAKVELSEQLDGAHGLKSATITLLDQRRVLITQLEYDGSGPDAYFWGGLTDTPDTEGFIIANELGSFGVLSSYSKKDVTITLPADFHWGSDGVRSLSVWCVDFTENFGHVNTNGDYKLPPYIKDPGMSALANCEMLNEYLNAAWEIIDGYLVVELMGSIDQDAGYMAFGVGGDDVSQPMIGGDVGVAYYEGENGKVDDYYLQGKAFCSGESGACPDSNWQDNNQIEVLNSWRMNHVTTIRFKRPLISQETQRDRSIVTGDGQETLMIWAYGKLNSQGLVTRHTERGFVKLELGRDGVRNCEAVKKPVGSEVEGWMAERINTAVTPVIKAMIGPTGGAKGFESITGLQPWGIAWYLNGMLIPTVVVERGSTITFEVYGGNDDGNSAKYHPFYITDDKIGGYHAKTAEEKAKVTIYAGEVDGQYCEFMPTDDTKDPEMYATFEAFNATLEVKCDEGEKPGMITWTPDASTPEELYYQCYTHSHLGWKIKVVDDIDLEFSAASPRATVHIISLLVVSLFASLLTL